MGERMVIIGAGVAGLSAGCYARMNGYSTTILEMHTRPGGLCTQWTRNGYVIDGCVHWLVGSAPGHPFYRLWQELGVLPGPSIIDREVFVRVEGEGDKALVVYSDVDRLQAHLLEIAGEDAGQIKEFIRGIRRMGRLTSAPRSIAHWPRVLRLLASLPGILLGVLALRRWRSVTVSEFASSFENEFLREAFVHVLDFPEFPMVGLMMTLAWLDQGAAGYPVGGSQVLADALERRYLELGGEIQYGERVAEILVENDAAVGVRLQDGREERADVVVSAADGHATIFELLGGRYVGERLQRTYDSDPIFPPLLHVAFGVARDLPELSDSVVGIVFPLHEPVTIDCQRHTSIAACAYGFDPSLAPPGKTVLKVMLPSDHARWAALAEDPDAYRSAKEDAAAQVLNALEQRFPGLADEVEMTDVATPITWARYTGNWQGSFEGWLLTTKNLGRQLPRTLPGLRQFYMAGQWVVPGGGLPTAAQSGRTVVRQICAASRKRFVTSLPAPIGGEDADV
ncbi:MAG: NAD(P)/FAD-dependent oxidoreductase [Candidatus Bipolaricaulota bacterium]|nr:MAG: NAD(P)/FAD-dependent oxidoreductase [Candidatus Bipolaricaulota bacterium]